MESLKKRYWSFLRMPGNLNRIQRSFLRMPVNRKMRYTGIFLALFCTVFLWGCSLDQGPEKDRTDLEFTVTETGKIPEELQKVMEEHKEEEIQLTYTDQGNLYVVRGYGQQETGGYSIVVDECSEGKEKIYITTTLIGPDETDALSKDPSYPMIVLKMEARDKEVVFQ